MLRGILTGVIDAGRRTNKTFSVREKSLLKALDYFPSRGFSLSVLALHQGANGSSAVN
jgi:hypothetical protein